MSARPAGSKNNGGGGSSNNNNNAAESTATAEHWQAAHEEARRAKMAYLRGLARWLMFPSLFTLAVIAVALAPDACMRYAPALWRVDDHIGTGVEDALPLFTDSPTAAFELGRLYEVASAAEKAGDAAGVTAALEAAAAVVGRTDPVNLEQLHALPALLQSMEDDASNSIVARVRGALSLVNVLFGIAIVGITATILPCMFVVLRPVMQWLVQVTTAVWTRVIKPVGIFCHEHGVFEGSTYALAWLLVVQGQRYPPTHATTGTNVAALGAALFIPCFFYSAYLHGGSRRRSPGDFDKLLLNLALFTAPIFGSLAAVHGSALLAWVAVLAVYTGTGFTMFIGDIVFWGLFCARDPGGMTFLVWRASSMGLVVALALCRVAGLGAAVLHPFVSPVMVMGCNGWFLVSLVLTLGSRRPMGHHVVMAVSLALFISAGTVFALPSLSNTGLVYLCLYVASHASKAAADKGLFIVVLFAGFVALYYVAHYLSAHPAFLVALFTGDDLLQFAG